MSLEKDQKLLNEGLFDQEIDIDEQIDQKAISGFDEEAEVEISISNEFKDEIMKSAEISICNIETEPEQPEKVSQRETRFREKIEKEEGLRFQIPPDYQISLQHWERTSINYSLSKSKLKDTKLKDFDKESLPKNSSQKSKNQPFLTNPFTLKGFGTSIPVYYLFILCSIVILIEAYIPLYIIGSPMRKAYCQFYEATNPPKSALY